MVMGPYRRYRTMVFQAVGRAPTTKVIVEWSSVGVRSGLPGELSTSPAVQEVEWNRLNSAKVEVTRTHKT